MPVLFSGHDELTKTPSPHPYQLIIPQVNVGEKAGQPIFVDGAPTIVDANGEVVCEFTAPNSGRARLNAEKVFALLQQAGMA